MKSGGGPHESVADRLDAGLRIRPLSPVDTPLLLDMAAATGVFRPLEIEALQEVLDDYHGGNRDWGHRGVVGEREGGPVGFAYYAPAPLTDRTWYLYWIVVSRSQQRQGWGGQLLRYVENDLRASGARLLLIETSATPAYAPTRAFYRKHGYQECAVIPDFYADGDSMVIFCRRL